MWRALKLVLSKGVHNDIATALREQNGRESAHLGGIHSIGQLRKIED